MTADEAAELEVYQAAIRLQGKRAICLSESPNGQGFCIMLNQRYSHVHLFKPIEWVLAAARDYAQAAGALC